MLTYDLEKEKGRFLYEKLYSAIKRDIIARKIRSGERLPSKRALSEHLHISKVTVESAYARLCDEGICCAENKRGYFVSNALPPVATSSFDDVEADVGDRSGKREKYEIDFCSNAISSAQFPFSVWSHLMRSVILDYGCELLASSDKTGALILKRAICEYLLKTRGMNVLPEQIIIGAGSEYLYGLLSSLLPTGAVIGVEDPGYGAISKSYELSGKRVKYIPLDGEGISVFDLYASGADVLHISPGHHFPSGKITSSHRREEIGKWLCKDKKRLIIEDEYDTEFRQSGAYQMPLATIFPQRVIYLNTFSKTISPSLRIAYMVLPQDYLKKYNEKMGFLSCTVPAFEQYTLAKFIEGGYFERHIGRRRRELALIRELVMNAISTYFPPKKYRIEEENAGTHFLLCIECADEDGIRKNLERAGVHILFESDYTVECEKSRGKLIMNYTGLDKNEVDFAIKALSSAIFEK